MLFLLSSQNFHILFLYLSLEVIGELEVNSLKTLEAKFEDDQ